jgi:hypothetical protein
MWGRKLTQMTVKVAQSARHIPTLRFISISPFHEDFEGGKCWQGFYLNLNQVTWLAARRVPRVPFRKILLISTNCLVLICVRDDDMGIKAATSELA